MQISRKKSYVVLGAGAGDQADAEAGGLDCVTGGVQAVGAVLGRRDRAAVVAHQAAEFDAFEALGDRAQLRDLRAHGLG